MSTYLEALKARLLKHGNAAVDDLNSDLQVDDGVDLTEVSQDRAMDILLDDGWVAREKNAFKKLPLDAVFAIVSEDLHDDYVDEILEKIWFCLHDRLTDDEELIEEVRQKLEAKYRQHAAQGFRL
ncbi:hypothetical protein [Devosia nitrariae]|nr:hypothetical protein [Devosia nitrariae]